MRLPVGLLGLGVRSAWLPDTPDPLRAGERDAGVLDSCPAEGCDLALYKSGDEFVCNNRHAYRWDDEIQGLTEADG